ncbi:MAG: hypothetical protein SVO01_00575 [Thermotogota bacterium]|nr:hypothetical protein [Thermotogota bacterium]
MINLLTIIHADQPEKLEQFRDKSTHWLPEFDFKPSNDIYTQKTCKPYTICTTKNTTLELIKVMIQSGKLQHDKILWIDANDPKFAIGYTFNQTGNFNNFFRIK